MCRYITVHFVAADPGFVASDIWRSYNVVFRTVASALALNTAEVSRGGGCVHASC